MCRALSAVWRGAQCLWDDVCYDSSLKHCIVGHMLDDAHLLRLIHPNSYSDSPSLTNPIEE